MKKIFTSSIASILASLLISGNAFALPIHTLKEVTEISDSVTMTRANEFYANHNVTYTLIEADLTDDSTKLSLLTPTSGPDTFDTVTNLAKTNPNTVAAMNADFFSVQKGGKGFSTGIEIKDGKLLQSPIEPDKMATVYATASSAAMTYLKFQIMAVAPNGQFNEVRHLNKHTSWYGDILMYTSEFNGGYSPAPGGVVVEVVVEDGKIKEFRRNMPPVAIPQNGCVLSVSEGVNMFLANNFNVGDEIKFDYYMTPDLSNIETAFGAGAMLVSEGKALTKFSHVISGTHPRSSIGIDQSGTKVYLVAVDGRQSSSKGMTMTELAALMQSLGCYTAVNLDGGGSTNMVASTVDNEAIHTVNSPSENRRVSNAVGILHTVPKGEASQIALTPSYDTVFIGDTVNISAIVQDSNKRPVGGNVTLSSSYGTVSGMSFIPSVGGYVTVEAQSGAAYGYTTVYVVDKVSGIEVNPYIHLNVGGSAELGIRVHDEEGHYIPVSNAVPFEITSSDPTVASVSGQTVTAHKSGNTIISVKKDGAISYASVSVGNASMLYSETFETTSGSLEVYPTYVRGNFEISGDYAASGKSSGKITYDFSDENDDTKAVYYKLNPSKTISDSETKLTISAYTPAAFQHELRAQLTDASGKVHRIVFGKNLSPASWHTLSAALPSDAVHPIRLDKIYAVYVKGEAKDSGVIYIDNLTFNAYDSVSATQFESAPINIYPEEKKTALGSNIFRVGAFSSDKRTLLTYMGDNRIYANVSASPSHAIIGTMPVFTAKEDANALYISLNTSKGGIRATDSSQWNSLANAMYNSSKQNVFIMSEDSIFGNSETENKVIREYLSSLHKNIFVITGGDRNTYKNIDGVKYFTLINTEKTAITQSRADNYLYLEFSFGDETTFEWKKVF